jgi:hypothetical protein
VAVPGAHPALAAPRTQVRNPLGSVGGRIRLPRVRERVHLGRRTLAALGALLAAVVAIGVIVATTASGSSGGTKAPAVAAGAATVQRRNLVETDTESGTLGYATSQTVFNRLSGTITSLPSVGQVVQPGQTLYEVDNQPVVLMGGSTPAFRDLSPSDTAGPDILELNRDLVSLGFDASDPITVNDTWQDATTSAVERWQGSFGQAETGTISLGQVVFLPGAQRVTAIDDVLGSTGGSGSGGGAGAGAAGSGSASTSSSVAVIPRPQFVSLTKTTTTPTTPRTTTAEPPRPSHTPPATSASSSSNRVMLAELKALEALLKAETAELRATKAAASASARGSGAGGGSARAGGSGGSAPSRSGGGGGSSASAGGGGGASSAGGGATSSGAGANAEPIMQTSSTQMVVTVDLDASKQSEAVVGAPVTVQMPDGSNVDGKITAVSPVAQNSSSSSSGSGSSSSSGGGSSSAGGSGSSGATVPVTVSLPAHLSTTGLDQAAVSVNFEQQAANNVLSVPVTALLATQGGGYAVQEAVPPHQLLPVTVGLFAAGYVQISGDIIYPGLQVTDSQG